MQELIKIQEVNINNEEVNAVSARELHEVLGSRQDFSTWVKNRITDGKFVEGVDYIRFHKKMEANNATKIEYYISLDMAKHFAMLERNDEGYRVRQYFIECEKQLHKALPQKHSLLLGIMLAGDDLSRAVAINDYEIGYVKPLENKVEEQAEIITQQAPKVTYYDLVLQSEDLMNIGQIAKDFEITAQKLNKILHEEGIQYKDKSGVWLLYAKHLNNQYAQTVTNAYEVNGKTHTKLHLKWTQRGRLFIYDTLKARGILPVIEKEVK